MIKPTQRFSDRVTDYIKYRPSYPVEIVNTLVSGCNLNERSTIADIGSGTGIFTQLLLQISCKVIGVEPNDKMRAGAEQQLATYSNFSSVDGQSESTGLVDSTVDLITVAQAFHWFDLEKTQREFDRILKPNGYVALIWNRRNMAFPFQREYDEILRENAVDYGKLNHMNMKDKEIETFFHPGTVSFTQFTYSQLFDLPALLGRIQSASYTPMKNTIEHKSLMRAAESLYKRYEINGLITFDYETDLYLGQFSPH